MVIIYVVVVFNVCLLSFYFQISPDEVSDNEGDPNSGIEVADFEDPLSPNGESKRSGGSANGGDSQHSSGAMKACEAALAAALMSNKAYIRKNEELTMELDTVRDKFVQMSEQQYERAVNDLEQKQSSNQPSGQLEQELVQCREQMELQEMKLKQAAEFVSFQEDQIQDLRDEVEDAKEQLAIASGDHDTTAPRPSSGRMGLLREEVRVLTEQVEKFTKQIEDGAVYVDHLQDQLDEANEQVSLLRAAADGNEDLDALRAELAEKQEKTEQAAEFIKYQEDRINELTTEVEELKAIQHQNSSSSSSSDAELSALRLQMEELEGRLAQGATYCEFVQSQLDTANAEIENNKHTIAELQLTCDNIGNASAIVANAGASTSTSDVAKLEKKIEKTQLELDQSRELCTSYIAQMRSGSSYVDELKVELSDAQKRLVRLEKLQSSSKGRQATGGYDANTARISNLEDELAASFAELEKMRAKLASGGATQNEVQFYKSQNETYLMKLQQGADYVDMLQSHLQKAEENSAGGGGGNDSSGRSMLQLEEELRECKAICMKFGMKLEQAAQLIENLESQRDEARDEAAEGKTAVDGLKKATFKTNELSAALGAKDELLRVATGRGGGLNKADLDVAIQRVAKDVAQARAAGDAAHKEVSRLQKQLHAANSSGGSEGRQKLLIDMEEILSSAANKRRCEQLEAIVAELRASGGGDLPSDHVVQELIEYKMKFAAAATDVDHERRKCKELSLKLQAATKRIDALNATMIQTNAAANEPPKGMFSFLTGSRSRSTSQASSMAQDSAHGSITGSVAGSEAGYRDSRMRSAPIPRHGPVVVAGRGGAGQGGMTAGGRGHPPIGGHAMMPGGKLAVVTTKPQQQQQGGAGRGHPPLAGGLQAVHR